MERERDQTPDQWRDLAARFAWFLAATEQERAGIAAGRPADASGSYDLISMWVAPAHRHRGVGSLLVSAVRAWAVEAGARELSLWVVDGNTAAARTYGRAGFVPTGQRQPLPSNPVLTEELWVLALTGAGFAERDG